MGLATGHGQVDVGQNLGTLTLGSDGTYTYSVSNAAVQNLNSGQSKLETFEIQSVDGTTQQVTFTINGNITVYAS